MPFLVHRAGPSLDFLHFHYERTLEFFYLERTYAQDLFLVSTVLFPVRLASELSTLAISTLLPIAPFCSYVQPLSAFM